MREKYEKTWETIWNEWTYEKLYEMNENIWEYMDENMDIMLEKQERTLDYST